MKIFAIDIETIPNQYLPESCVPQFDPDSVKMGNLKDPAKIQVKLDEEKTKFNDGLVKQMSLDPAFAQLCTFVGITYDTEERVVDTQLIVAEQLTDMSGGDDLYPVTTAWATIQQAYLERTPLVSFNGISFDLPILFFRAITQDVPIDRVMYQRLTTKWGDNAYHYDLMQILANWDRQRWHSFDFYTRLFGLGEKEDFDGSMVYEAYQAGQYQTIREYCVREVTAMCNLFARLEPWIKNERRDE